MIAILKNNAFRIVDRIREMDREKKKRSVLRWSMHSFKKNYTRRMFRYVLRIIILTTLLTRIASPTIYFS